MNVTAMIWRQITSLTSKVMLYKVENILVNLCCCPLIELTVQRGDDYPDL